MIEIEELIANARDAVSVKRVYGDPYEKNGLTVIPAATVRGGGGAGKGEKEAGESGTGGGFGLTARPTGAWIIENDHVNWKPAIDVNRVVLGGQVIALIATLVTGRVLFAHAQGRPRLLDRAPRLPERPSRRRRRRPRRPAFRITSA